MIPWLIAKHIQDNALGTIAEDIFETFMPADVAEGILVKVPLSGVDIDHELPNRYCGRNLQVIIRATTHAAGDVKAKAVRNLLTISEPTILTDVEHGTMDIDYIRPETEPIVFPRADGGIGIEWSMNFDCCYVMT